MHPARSRCEQRLREALQSQLARPTTPFRSTLGFSPLRLPTSSSSLGAHSNEPNQYIPMPKAPLPAFGTIAHISQTPIRAVSRRSNKVPQSVSSSASTSTSVPAPSATYGLNSSKRITNRQILAEWYAQHEIKPYPSVREKTALATASGLSVAQVATWFSNRRNRTSNVRRRLPHYFLEDCRRNPLAMIKKLPSTRSRGRLTSEQSANPSSTHKY